MPISSQEQYDKAKALVDTGKAKDPVRLQRSMQRWERFAMPQTQTIEEGLPASLVDGLKSSGEQLAVEENTEKALSGMNSWLINSKSDTAEMFRSEMSPEQFQARRDAVDWGKKIARDESIKGASKLKVFNDPPEYDPPTLKGSPLSSLSGLKPTVRYFEPTVGEFRQVIAEDERLASRLREQNPDIEDLSKLSEKSLEESDAFRVYADARWQHALADAMRDRTPIRRVSYTDADWMGGGQVRGEDGEIKVGDRKASVADVMDGIQAAGVGALQGASFGGYDLAQTALGADEMRDSGRGSMDRHPVLGVLGGLYGSLSKRGGPSRLARGISAVGKPSSLAGRVGKAGAAGLATAVLDDNARSAARLAADALDAQDTAAEGLARIAEGLPGFAPQTMALGAGTGMAGDLIGAASGALARGAPRALDLKTPLQRLEKSGGQINMVGGPKLSPRAQAYANRAGRARTQAQDMIAEGAVQPMARQVLLEQEAAKRAAELETNVAQAGLEGRTVPSSGAVAAIKADAAVIRPVTAQAVAQKRELEDIAARLGQAEQLRADELDEFIQQVDKAAKQGQANKAPIEHLNNVSRHLRNLRDRLGSYGDDVTVADRVVEDKGLFTAEPDPTLVEPQPRNIAGIRDADGTVKPVEGYSELKARQHRQKTIQEFKNARALGGGDVVPQTLSAEPVFARDVVDKGLFNPQTPEEIVAGIKPTVSLNLKQHSAIKQNIRKVAQPDNLADTEEILALAKRVGPGMERKLRIIQQLDDADELASALGRAISGVSAKGGKVGAFLDRKQLFRLVPTLSSLGGGLPARKIADSETVNRLKQFVTRLRGPGSPVEASPLEVMPRPSRELLEGHRAAVAKAAQTVTPEEAEAVRRFTRGYDESIRSLQRGGSPADVAARNPRGAEHAREAAESLPHLESYIRKMPPAREVPYVYRGIVVPEAEAKKLLEQGTIFADPYKKAVTSVSADPMVARSFVARNLEPGQIGFQLKLKHRSAVGTSLIADEKMAVEKELLLPGSAKFRVVKRYADKSNPGQFIIEAEEVGSLGEAAGELAGRLPSAASKGVAGFKSGLRSKDKQSTFMPQAPSLNLRAGLPSRAVGAALDEPDKSTTEFTPEEEDFWLQVLDNLAMKEK